MVVEVKFAVEVKAQVLPDRFRGDDRTSDRCEINRGVGGVSSSCKMKVFCFAMFYDKASVEEDF